MSRKTPTNKKNKKESRESLDLNTSLTPVKLLRPPEESPSKGKGIADRLDTILQSLKKNHEKWEAAQKRATALCRIIEAIKVRNFPEEKFYPEELAEPCKKLAVILTIFQDVSVSARESLKQLKALEKLNDNKDAIFYKTWVLSDFIELAENAVEKYEKEVEVKKIVTENIAHCTDHPQLIMHTGACTYPYYADREFNIAFKMLEVETSSKWS